MSYPNIFLDAGFAAVAGIGFGAISDPPVKAFSYIAILSAIGHAVRYSMMHYVGIDIATASLMASLSIGIGSLIFGKKALIPMTVMSIPSLLPMVPGIFFYKTVLSLIMFLRTASDDVQSVVYMQSLWTNFLLAFTTTFNLALGVTLPHLIFKEKAHTLTRRKNIK